MKPPQKIILYGGSFDPPHRGHLRCIEATLKHFPEAQVWVSPTPSPPIAKAHIQDSSLVKTVGAPYEERVSLCQSLFCNPNSRKTKAVIVDDFESHLPPPQYTWSSIHYLLKNKLLPEQKLYLAIGEDQYVNFQFWHKAEKIRELVDLIVCRRADITHTDLDHMTEWFEEKGHNAHIIHEIQDPANSTEIRKLIQEHKPLPDGWVNSADEKKLRTIYERK